MKIRVAAAVAGLLALAACNEPNANVVENIELNAADVANTVESDPPVSNATNVTAPEPQANATADAQTQEDAVATGMTSRVDRANETDAQ